MWGLSYGSVDCRRVLDQLVRIRARRKEVGHHVRRSAALAGPREGDAMEGKSKGVYKAVYSILDAAHHSARGAVRPECELCVRTSSDGRDKFLHEADVSPYARAVGIAEDQYRRHLNHQYESVFCRRDGGLYVVALVEYRIKLRDFVHGLGVFRVDADAFARKSWIRFLCVSGFSGLRRVIYISCPAGLITNKW